MPAFPYCLAAKNISGYASIPTYSVLPNVNVISYVTNKDIYYQEDVSLNKYSIEYLNIPTKITDTIESISGSSYFIVNNKIVTSISGYTGNYTTSEFVNVYGKINHGPQILNLPISNYRNYTYINYISGSCADYINKELSLYNTGVARPQPDLTTISGYNSTVSLFISSGQRNPNIWTSGMNLNGVSCWTSSYGTYWLPTAITQRHIINANHINGLWPTGTKIRFALNNGTVIERSITKSTRIGTTDLLIGTLDSDLPLEIKPFKLLSLPKLRAILPSLERFYIPAFFIKSRNEGQNCGGNVLSCVAKIQESYGIPAGYVRIKSEGELVDYPPYPEQLFDAPSYGDSGDPVFLSINQEPTLLGVFYSPFGGSSSVAYFDNIQSYTSGDGNYPLSQPTGNWTNFS